MSKSCRVLKKTEARADQESSGESDGISERLAAKARWKEQPGHRYTPEQLEKMAETDVTIKRMKRVIMRY